MEYIDILRSKAFDRSREGIRNILNTANRLVGKDTWVVNLAYCLVDDEEVDLDDKRVAFVIDTLVNTITDILDTEEKKNNKIDSSRYIPELIAVVGESADTFNHIKRALSIEFCEVVSIEEENCFERLLEVKPDITVVNTDLNHIFYLFNDMFKDSVLNSSIVLGLTDNLFLQTRKALRKIFPNISSVHSRQSNNLGEFIEELGVALRLKRVLKDKECKDQLTNLYNRKYFTEVIDRLELHETLYSVGIIDIDKFKSVNDTYGHDCGDVVLRETADFLTNSLTDKCYLFRFGGEEFAIVFENKSTENTVKLMNEIRVTYSERLITYNEVVLKKTFSCGISEKSEGIPIKELLLRADKSLYEAKESGRNKVVSWNEINNSSITDNSVLVVVAEYTSITSRIINNKFKALKYVIKGSTEYEMLLNEEDTNKYSAVVFYKVKSSVNFGREDAEMINIEELDKLISTNGLTGSYIVT